MMRGFCLAVVLALGGPAAASVPAGVAKWQAGDWSGAVAEWAGPAARGDADALFNMGQAYNLGRGVAQNRALAQDHYRRAAEKGHVAATANLGISLFQEGRRAEALPHLRRAADRGDARAAYVLGVATFNGEGVARNQPLGYGYMLRARASGLSQASQQSARMAALMSADARARGEAVAAALDAGEPIPDDLIGGRPVQVAAAPAPSPQSRIVVEQAPAGPPGPQGEPSGEAELASADAGESAGDRAAPGDGWRVQLGAFANEGAARTAWATLLSQAGQLLEGARPLFAARGGLVRLQVGPFADRSAARDLCQRLSAAGRPCFVTGN
jgi:cell division septation protein DedD